MINKLHIQSPLFISSADKKLKYSHLIKSFKLFVCVLSFFDVICKSSSAPTIRDLPRLLSEADTVIQSHLAYLRQDGIAVIGETGSGKSTMINHCCLFPLKYLKTRTPAETAQGLRARKQIVEASEGLPYLKMGVRGSVTQGLGKLTGSFRGKRLIFWDTPGFKDTQGSIAEIVNVYYIRRLLMSGRTKILFVMPYSDIEDSGRGMRFADKLQKLINFIPITDQFLAATMILFNKAPCGTDEDDICSALEDVLRCPTLEINIKRFIRYVKVNRTYSVFHRPTTLGNVLSTATRRPILKKLNGRQYMTINPQGDSIFSHETVEFCSTILTTYFRKIRDDFLSRQRASITDGCPWFIMDIVDELTKANLKEALKNIEESRSDIRQIIMLLPLTSERIIDEIVDDSEETLRAFRSLGRRIIEERSIGGCFLL